MERTILIIEDNETFGELTKEAILLESPGTNVKVANSLISALKLINRHKFDMIVTDCRVGPASDFKFITGLWETYHCVALTNYPGHPALKAATIPVYDKIANFEEFLNYTQSFLAGYKTNRTG